ncbi:hypothetical protein D9M70_580140 [compost metagenome]
MQPRAARQAQQIDTPGGDVLAHRAFRHVEAGELEFVMQLAVDQVHLPQIGLRRIRLDAGAVLDGNAEMGIALHAQPRQQHDRGHDRFAERMRGATRHGGHDGIHHVAFLSVFRCLRLPGPAARQSGSRPRARGDSGPRIPAGPQTMCG